MKRIYKCELCGADFDDERECEEHENECLKPENLIRRIRELEAKVEMLETLLKFKDNPPPVNIPPCPNPYPPSIPPYPAVPPYPSPWSVTCTSQIDANNAKWVQEVK